MTTERCMIYRQNTPAPEKPRCEGCLTSDELCATLMWEDGAPCCGSCCHRDKDGRCLRVDGISPKPAATHT